MVGKKSFTLVEISIVMCVVALLIGSLMGGRKIVERAKVQTTIHEIQQYQSAFAKFYDTYGWMPGDMPDAQAKLAPSGYATADINTIKTLDEKILRTIPLDGLGRGFLFNCILSKNASNQTQPYGDATGAPYFSDSILTWSHLSAAGLLEEKYSSLCKSLTSLNATDCFEVGYNLPRVTNGTGKKPVYLFRSLPKEHYTDTCAGNEYTYGLLVKQKVYNHVVLEIVDYSMQVYQHFNDSYGCIRSGGGAGRRWQAANGGINAQRLAEIDIKIDDGFPLTGNVAAQNAAIGSTLNISLAHPCVKVTTASYTCKANEIRGQLQPNILNNPTSLSAINMYNGTDEKALCIGVFAMPQF